MQLGSAVPQYQYSIFICVFPFIEGQICSNMQIEAQDPSLPPPNSKRIIYLGSRWLQYEYNVHIESMPLYYFQIGTISNKALYKWWMENIKQCSQYCNIVLFLSISNFPRLQSCLSMDFVTSNINLELTDIYPKKSVHTASFTNQDNSIKKLPKTNILSKL